jgi:hypothetical protein
VEFLSYSGDHLAQLEFGEAQVAPAVGCADERRT